MVIFILLTLFILYQYIGKAKFLGPSLSIVPVNSMTTIENFSGDNMCSLTPKLLDVNYDKYNEYQEKLNDNLKSKYYIKGAKENVNNDNKYLFVIEDSQPFHNDMSNEEDYHEIGDIRQSNHFIWVMDQARTRLVRASRHKMTEKKWIDVLLPLEAYKEDNEKIRFKKNQLITGWGVSNDDLLKDQWVVLFVSDLNTVTDSYFVFFKVTLSINVPVFGDFDELNKNAIKILSTEEKKSLFYVKVKDKYNLYGSIYFKQNKIENRIDNNKDKNIYTLYSCAYNIESETNVKSTIKKINIDLKKGKKIEPSVDLVNPGINVNYYSLGKGINVNEIYENLHIYGNLLFIKKKEIKKIDYQKLEMKDQFNEVKKYIEIDSNNDKLNNYFNDNDLSDLQKNRFGVYKFFAEMLFYLAKCRYLGGILDLKMDYETDKLYVVKFNTNSNSNNLSYFFKKTDKETDIKINIDNDFIQYTYTTIQQNSEADNSKLENILALKDAIVVSSQILSYLSVTDTDKNPPFELDKKIGYKSNYYSKVYYLNTFYNLPNDSNDNDKFGKRQNLKKFYTTSNIDNNKKDHIQDSSQNVIGILDLDKNNYDEEPSPKIKSFVKKPRKVIYTLYQEIINNFDIEKITFGRVNNKPISIASSECIPAHKFTYNKDLIETELKSKTNEELPNKVNSVKHQSLFQFFKKTMATSMEDTMTDIKADTTVDNTEQKTKKFTNLDDWIHIYDLMRDEGIYDIKSQDPSLELLNNSIENNNYFMNNPDKWTDKHPDLLMLGSGKIYDKEALKNYPNILTFNLSGEKTESLSGEKTESVSNEKEKKVYLHLKFKQTTAQTKFTEDMNQGEIVDEDFNFIKLEFDTSRLGNESPSYSEMIDDKKYDFYKLMMEPKRKVLGNSLQEKQKYQWFHKTINNFDDFNKFILEDVSNEEDSRDRLRGLYEIPDMYVDDKYIKYLQDSRTAIGLKEINDLILKKKKISDKNMVYKDDKDYVNLVGYPFIVFYKYIDYNGVPCEPFAKNKQKIILSNRVLPSNIVNNKLQSTRGAPFNLPKYQYPLVKQEFFSFSGNGTTIQYYEKKFGGITSIDPKKICGEKESTFMDACNRQDGKGCAATILSYTSISGIPKCEIDDESVIKKSISPVEVLLPQAVSVHACDIFLVKGNIKLYFTLGKIFGQSKEKYQLRGIYTIKNKEDKYYFVSNKNIFETDESMVVDNLGVVKDEFKFYTRLKTDVYGKYYMLESYSLPGNFLTAKYHPVQHTIGGIKPIDSIPNMKFTLEPEMKVDLRNHLNDEDYYSQKFNMNDALLYNTAADDIGNKLLEEMERKKRMEDSLAAHFFPEFAIGDKSFREPMTTEEENITLERLLDDINSYLRKVIRINPVELPNVEALTDNLEEITVTMKSRIPLIKDRIQNLKYQVKFNDQNKLPSIYSKFSYPKTESKAKVLEKTENNISTNNKAMTEITKKMTIKEMGSALEAIKNFVPKSTRNPGQCKKLVEGFESMYNTDDMSNHLVDTYNDFVTSKVGKTETNMKKKKDNLFDRLKSVGGKINSLKLDGSNEQVRITQDLEKGMNVKGSVYKIRDGEQKKRMVRMESKLEEIDKLRCKLGDVSNQTKVKDHPNYNSIVSREDGSLLNVYKLSGCDKISEEEKKLHKNMIFVNGGCLSYDDKNSKIKVEHCMVNDKKQHFQLHQMREQNDLQAFNIRNTLKPGEELDSPHYVITKPKEYGQLSPAEGPAESIHSSDVCDYKYSKFNTYTSDVNEKSCQKYRATNLCLDSRKGELSMRDCSNVKPQSWDYSDITGPCK